MVRRKARCLILDHNLNPVGGFITQQAAEQHALTDLPSTEHPFFIEDKAGEIVALVYAGNVWIPKTDTDTPKES